MDIKRPDDLEDDDKPCRACSDFKSWAKQQNKATLKKPKSKDAPSSTTKPDVECPLDKGELGNATWGFLHSMASYYPKDPTPEQESCMKTFFKSFSMFYPCEPCALDFQKDIKENPVQASSRDDLAKWLCDRHNTVNEKLGKPKYDCSKVHERWKDGWADGSCDDYID